MKITATLFFLILLYGCRNQLPMSGGSEQKSSSAEKPLIYGHNNASADPMVLKMPADSLNGPVKMPSPKAGLVPPVPMPTLKSDTAKLK